MVNTNSSRRSFLAMCGAMAASACTGRPAHSGGRTRIPFIDIHTHLGAFHHGRELTAELLVKFMDVHGVEKACVLPLISPESAPIVQPVTTAIAASQEFPDRIIPFCCVDPRCVTPPGSGPGTSSEWGGSSTS